ncbi:hypothetical protein FKM82_017671, partial [Ascaphus truei]
FLVIESLFTTWPHREGLQTPQPKWFGVSGWESIFSTVKAQVPSIDSDEASLSDGEDDELFIFQREDVCCVPDLVEDLIEEEGDPECQGMAVPVTLHSEAWLGAERSPESQTEQGTHITAPEHNREHVNPHINPLERRPETPTPTQSEPSVGPAWSSGEDLLENGDGHWHGLQPRDMETLTMLNHSQVDSRAGAQGGSAAAAGQLGCDSLPAEHMGLSLESLQCLEKWDLDSILQQLKEVGDREVPHGMTSEPADSADKISSSFLLAENPSVKREDQIMEQLVQLSAKQSQALAHVRQVALGTEEHLNSESSYRLGLLQQELNMAGGWRQHKKTPTVFIDLRTAAHQDMLTEGERQPEEPAQSEVKEEKLVQNKSQRTGKSLLLQHLRHARRVSSPDVPDLNPPQSNTATEWRGSPDEAAAPQIRRKRRLRTREDISKSTPKILEEAESEGRDIREERPQVEERVTHDLPPSPKKGQRSPSTEDLAQREKLAKEKQGRQRMQTQLEGLKPRNSVTGRQPMAEETPVLFHP